MQMNATITKIAKSSDTIEGKKANQFATPVKVKRICSYETQKQDEEEQEPSFMDRKT